MDDYTGGELGNVCAYLASIPEAQVQPVVPRELVDRLACSLRECRALLEWVYVHVYRARIIVPIELIKADEILSELDKLRTP